MQHRSPGAESPGPPNPRTRRQRLFNGLDRALVDAGAKRLPDENPDKAAVTARALASVPVGTAVTVCRVERLTVRWQRTTSSNTGMLVRRIAPRSRERRRGVTRRASSSSRTSSTDPGSDSDSDPEPPSRGRLCPGCGDDISHKRRNAKTCGRWACQKKVQRSEKKVERAAAESAWSDLAADIEKIESRIEELLVERQAAWRSAARDGGHRFLTSRLADELQSSFATRAALLTRYARDAHPAAVCPGHGEHHRLRLVIDGHCLKCGRGTGVAFGGRTTAAYSLPPAQRTASIPGRWPIVRAA